MKTSIVYTLALALATVALLPVASADPIVVGPATIDAGSSQNGSGDCDGGNPYYYEGNAARVTVVDGTTTHNAQASTYCYSYTSPWGTSTGSGINANYYSYDSQTWDFSYAGASWYAYTFGSGGGGCGTVVTVYNVGGQDPQSHNLGCPAGNPPHVPALLP